ncbi:MAG: sugar phosphate isomerase/epimerase [Defluviitaleaceae bacterium]|nr:sugar phosphate isomerase/epimerase [Defluviitaleaceae bacterium]
MKIGAQLYTVREHTQTAADFAATIKKVANMGYKRVQVSAIGPIPAQEVADICKTHEIDIVITHTNPARIKDETEAVIAEHRIMGADYIGIGATPGGYERNKNGVRQFIVDFTPAAQKIKDAGMTLMYHNHDFEFEKYDSKLMMGYLVEEFPLLGFTLDTYWVQAGGADPSAWIKALAGRVDVVHLKDMAWAGGKQLMAEVMEGNLNWHSIFDACTAAGVQYAMVEQDDCYGANPFKCLEKSLNNLKEAKKWFV